ncbi:MAG: hypothetical protein ACTS4U_01185 [Candidatus Hodgkinia cicadicola]
MDEVTCHAFGGEVDVLVTLELENKVNVAATLGADLLLRAATIRATINTLTTNWICYDVFDALAIGFLQTKSWEMA